MLSGCSPIKNLPGETFSYKSKKRTLDLIFENDSTCKLINTFKCKDIDPEIQQIIINCKYKRIGDTIILSNIKCLENIYNEIFIDLPIQESCKCEFLNKENRGNDDFYVGPRYITDYQKYGIIPNIDIDTLYIINREIILVKYSESMSIGFTFK